MSKSFFLEVITPVRKFFEGNVEMIVVESVDGQLAVLKGHIPMVTPIAIGTLRIKEGEKWHEAAIGEGFMEVRPDSTTILSHSVEWPEEIDERRAHEALERAEERVRQKKSMNEYHQSKTAMARAMARLRVKKRYN